jgi:serine/threonine-protein kinase HipA
MALKLANSHAFPDYNALLGLAESSLFRIRDAKEIIDQTAQGIMDYLVLSNEVGLLNGLKASIERSVMVGMNRQAISKDYRHDKKRKFE